MLAMQPWRGYHIEMSTVPGEGNDFYPITDWGLEYTVDGEDFERFALRGETLELTERASWMLRGFAANPEGITMDGLVQVMRHGYPDSYGQDAREALYEIQRVFGRYGVSYRLAYERFPVPGQQTTFKVWRLAGLLDFGDDTQVTE